MKVMNTMLSLAIILALVGCGSNTNTPEHPEIPPSIETDVAVPTPEPEPETEPEPEPEPYTITLLGVGDNLIHSRIYQQAGARASSIEGVNYDFTFAYEPLGDYISRVDIASINQETVMAESYPPSSYPMFNSPQELAGTIADLGFDVINLANNHMFDRGETGLRETMDYLRGDGFDFTVVGTYYNEEDFWDIPIRTVEGVDFAFVGASQLTNGLSLPSSSEMYPGLLMTEEQVLVFLEQVERAAQCSDIVVANVHWGSEYTHTPSDFQKSLAQRMADAGADIIFGHHPHVIQPMEYLEANDGRTAIVCYSLGNFISTQDHGLRMIGGMMEVEILVDGEEISLDSVLFLPCITHYGPNGTNVQIYPYDSYTPELALAHGVRSYTSSFSFEYIKNTVASVIDAQFLPEDFWTVFP